MKALLVGRNKDKKLWEKNQIWFKQNFPTEGWREKVNI